MKDTLACVIDVNSYNGASAQRIERKTRLLVLKVANNSVLGRKKEPERRSGL